MNKLQSKTELLWDRHAVSDRLGRISKIILELVQLEMSYSRFLELAQAITDSRKLKKSNNISK